jgi:preprotein translocase subunit SecD
MRRTLALGFLTSLLLTGCGGGSAAPGSYALGYDTKDATRVTQLADASARVVTRRILGMNQKVGPTEVKAAPDKAHLSVPALPQETMDALTAQLKAPFTMSVMVETQDSSDPNVLLNNYGAFTPTALTEKYFDWVVAGDSQVMPGKGSVVIRFTKDGVQKLHDIFKQNQGKTIGIFVRGNLMSKKQIDPSDNQDTILVDGVPSTELAKVFADDVNVGLHVTFDRQ